MPKVSVIVPTYNVEMYLEECMESLVRQTLHDIEIICVNDGSKDSSLEILKRYAADDPRVVIIDKENGGYGKAMNVGLDRATGEYIGIVEPDDYVPLHMYEDLYLTAVREDLDFVKADFYRFTTEKRTGNMELVYNRLDRSKEWYGKVVTPTEVPLVTTFVMNTWSGIYKRSFLEEYHIRHHETPGASFQDNGFFWQTFMYAKRAMFVGKPYYMNRRDNPNSSVKSREKVYCMNEEYKYIREIFLREENKERWEKLKTYYNLKRYRNYIFTLKRIGAEFKQEYVRHIAQEFQESMAAGEVDPSLLNEKERAEFDLLMKDQDEFYEKIGKYTKQDDISDVTKATLSKRLRDIETSTTYKVGKMVMYWPIKIKKALKGK